MSNLDKAIELIGELATEFGQTGGNELFGLDEAVAQALEEANLITPDDMTVEYGVWWQLPKEEGISWERDEADLAQMLKNLRKHGYKAEKVARFVSPHRFITLTEEPK